MHSTQQILNVCFCLLYNIVGASMGGLTKVKLGYVGLKLRVRPNKGFLVPPTPTKMNI